MNVRPLYRSFAGGEIAPELYGRVDLTKFQTGLALCKNFIVLPHGPIANRAGFEFVNQVKDSTRKVRLIPFSYSAEQTYVLEFGHQYIRFHTNGGTVLEASQAITGVTKANPGVLTYTGADPTNGQWFFLAGIGGMTQLNGRYVKVANVNGAANTFELQDVNGVNINTTAYGTYTSGGTMSRVYEVASPFAEAELFDIHFVQSADVLTLVHPNHDPRELARLGATNWSLTTISFVPTIAAPGSVSATVHTGSGSVTYSYKVTAIKAGELEESLASSAASVNNDLSVGSNKNQITWGAVSGAVRYNVYKLFNGLYGFIGQTDGSAMIDNNITADVSRTPPEAQTPFSGSGNKPRAVGYFEGRRCWAGTTNKPQSFWATRSGTESNLSYSIPQRDDDAIAFTMKANEVHVIRHIVPLSDLILLTSSGEWRVAPQNSDVLTPASAAPKQQSAEGASNAQPVLTGNALIYAQARGGRVREMRYKWEQQGYTAEDASIMAPHLFDAYSIVDMAFSKAPHKVVWVTRSDGVLLGLTYVPEHQVIAWHQHYTDGLVESVTAVAEGREDPAYVVVKRNIGGADRRFIERMHTREYATLDECFFVDCGLSYDGAPATTISGIWHLEGEELAILADGAVHPRRTVNGGAVTLDVPASVVHLGLPYAADAKTLPLTAEAAAAGGQGFRKNVSKAYLRVNATSGVKAGPSFDRLRQYKQRTVEPYGVPPSLVTGVIELTLDNQWSDEGHVCLRQDEPLPFMLASMAVDAALGA